MTVKKQKTALIVEDDLIHVRVLVDRFTDEGFRALSAVNGKDGLAVALREQPDIILLDRVMPVMDGTTMLKKLRESGVWGKSVPVILLTNLSADEEAKKMISTTDGGTVDYIVKADWALSDVIKKVRERL